MSDSAKRIAELESDLGYLSTAVGTGFIPNESSFHDTTIANRAIRAANAHKAVAQRDKLLAALQGILESDVGRQTFQKLAEGQGTDTDDGRAWLTARHVVGGSE